MTAELRADIPLGARSPRWRHDDVSPSPNSPATRPRPSNGLPRSSNRAAGKT